MKHGSPWSIFSSAASYCIWQVEISYPISLPRNPINQYHSEVSLCLLHPQFHNSKHSHQQKVLFQTQYLMRCHLHVCTKRTTKNQEQCPGPGGNQTKPEPVRFYSIYNNLLLSEAKKRIYPFQCFATDFIAKQFAFKEFMRGVSNAFSKSNMNVSTCPLLSKILAQSFIIVVNWVSQLCPFLNACCLSDRSLSSSRWAMIFEYTMCSSNLQGTQVKETGQ